MKSVARTVVVFVRKSDVRRTPKTVPMFAPPKEPARPPPLLDCISTAIISNTLTRISTIIKNEYIAQFLCINVKKPHRDMGYHSTIPRIRRKSKELPASIRWQDGQRCLEFRTQDYSCIRFFRNNLNQFAAANDQACLPLGRLGKASDVF
jgi:hypothetical protein